MQVVIKRSPASIAYPIALVSPVFMGGLYLIATSYSFPNPTLPGFDEGCLCIALSGVLLSFCIRERRDRQAYIVIDDRGLRPINLSMEVIEWKEIRDAKLVTTQRGTYMALEVDNPGKFRSFRRGYTKFDRWMDKNLGEETINIDVTGLEMRSAEIIELVRSRMSQHGQWST